MIVDFQHHYVPRELAIRQGVDDSTQVEVFDGSAKKVTLHEKLFDAGAQVRDMDEAGVDVAVLSCLLAWDASSEDCRLTNSKMAEVQETHAGRFVGLAHIPAHQPEQAIEELLHAIENLSLKGVALTSQIMGRPLDDPDFFPIYEVIGELGVPIFVHPAMAPKGYALATDHDLGRILVREFDLCLATIRLIAGGVLETFPDLKFVIGHFGGGIAAIKERIAKRVHRFDRPLKRDFDEYFDMLYFDTAGFEGGVLALDCALRGISHDRLVFATDYPQDFTGVCTSDGDAPTIHEYMAAIREKTGDKADKIFGETAASLLAL